MSLVSDYDAMRLHFLDHWPQERQTVMLNAPAQEVNEEEPFTRFSVIPGVSERLTLGGESLHRQLGRVWLQIFVPKQEGATMAYELADEFGELFRDWQSSDRSIRCRTPEITTSDEDTNWWMVTVSVPYESHRRV